VGPLAQLRLAQGLTDDTALVLRGSLAAHVADGHLRGRGVDVDVADLEADVLHGLLDGQVVTVARLGHETARRLVAAGVLVAA
jgi:uncharacterized membrane protein (DUF441 family)